MGKYFSRYSTIRPVEYTMSPAMAKKSGCAWCIRYTTRCSCAVFAPVSPVTAKRYGWSIAARVFPRAVNTTSPFFETR